MRERTKLIRLKIERAEHHVRNLDTVIESFFKSGAYSHFREHDPETREFVWRVSVREEVPRDFALIIGDALQNLRSALDHLAWQLVLANSGTPDSNTGFPIGETPRQYESVFARKVKGMSQDAIDMIKALKPYGGGNEDLVGLHILNNADKHRILLVVAAAHVGTTVNIRDLLPFSQIARLHLPAPLDWAFPLKNGTELYRASDQINQEPEFTFQVAFGDAEVMNGQPLLPPLHQLVNFIDAIILSFDGLL